MKVARLETARLGIIHERRRPFAIGLAVVTRRISTMRRRNQVSAVSIWRMRGPVAIALRRNRCNRRCTGNWLRRRDRARTDQCRAHRPGRSRLRLRHNVQHGRCNRATIFARRAAYNLRSPRRKFRRRHVSQRAHNFLHILRSREYRRGREQCGQ